ncbi:MAG: MFS transporter [Halobacteriaceae archaeon]
MAAAAAMGVVGTYQFVWSVIRVGVASHLGAPETALGTVFTMFVVAQTVAGVPAGWVRDRYGPRLPMLLGSVAVTLGYLGTAVAGSVSGVLVAYTVGGIGAGAVYNVAVNTPVKWFTDRRGLATGVVTMAYSGVSAAFIPVVGSHIETAFAPTVTGLAVVTGLTCLVALLLIHDPDAAVTDGGDPQTDAHEWRETVRTWQFWVLYAVMVIVNGVGLMLVGKAVSLAAGLGLPAAAGTAAASTIAVAEAGGIAVVSGISDRFGAEQTIAVALVASGVGVGAAVVAGTAGAVSVFIVAVGAAAFFRSPVFAVFPGMVAEYYGTARSSENYAMLYTAKVPGGVVGGVAASAVITRLDWAPAFLAGGGLLVVAGVATAALRPVK